MWSKLEFINSEAKAATLEDQTTAQKLSLEEEEDTAQLHIFRYLGSCITPDDGATLDVPSCIKRQKGASQNGDLRSLEIKTGSLRSPSYEYLTTMLNRCCCEGIIRGNWPKSQLSPNFLEQMFQEHIGVMLAEYDTQHSTLGNSRSMIIKDTNQQDKMKIDRDILKQSFWLVRARPKGEDFGWHRGNLWSREWQSGER